MRNYPEDKSDLEDFSKLNAEDWMMEALKMNPDYVYWGPYEDYMCSEKSGWDSRVIVDSWDDFGLGLDDLNEVVNFYFEISRSSEECCDCEGSGYNKETQIISDTWYDFENIGRKWSYSITQDEVEALWDAGRLRHDFESKPTAEEVNAWARGKTMGHDAINKWICVEQRAKRLGVYGKCDNCHGDGYIFTEPKAKLGLVLWVLHPRKGCSRGVHVKEIRQNELPFVIKYLQMAAERNANRFSKLK